uniref:Hum s 3 allergen n=1 Tax=Humulus scandens TaxID=228586 RepID=A0A6J3WVY1_HUMSC|nr:Hum s 3 allergen [Humulus scandens]
MTNKMVVVFAIFLVVFAALNVSECNAGNCCENGMKECGNFYDGKYESCLLSHISCDFDSCKADCFTTCDSYYPKHAGDCKIKHDNICNGLP